MRHIVRREGTSRRSWIATTTVAALTMLVVAASSARDQATNPESNLNSLIERAKQEGDKRAERRLTNFRTALRVLKPSQLLNIRCGKDNSDIFSVVEAEIAEDSVGALLSKALEKIAPTIAAAINSATAAGATAFLTPERIAPDAVEVLNSSEKRGRKEVGNAARTLLQSTLPENFERLPPPMMAKIVACSA